MGQKKHSPRTQKGMRNPRVFSKKRLPSATSRKRGMLHGAEHCIRLKSAGNITLREYRGSVETQLERRLQKRFSFDNTEPRPVVGHYGSNLTFLERILLRMSIVLTISNLGKHTPYQIRIGTGGFAQIHWWKKQKKAFVPMEMLLTPCPHVCLNIYLFSNWHRQKNNMLMTGSPHSRLTHSIPIEHHCRFSPRSTDTPMCMSQMHALFLSVWERRPPAPEQNTLRWTMNRTWY